MLGCSKYWPAPSARDRSSTSATRRCSSAAWTALPIRSATRCRSCWKRRRASSRRTIPSSSAEGGKRVFRVVIPARYASARLPGKALLAIRGKPMLQWVYERAGASGAQEVLIATDDQLIVSAAHSFGAEAVMTAPTHASGTDRIAEVAGTRRWPEADIVVNVQGD